MRSLHTVYTVTWEELEMLQSDINICIGKNSRLGIDGKMSDLFSLILCVVL